MRRLLRFLISLILFIPRLILSVIWSVIKSLLVLAVVLLTMTYFLGQGGQTGLADAFLSGVDRVAGLLTTSTSPGLNNLSDRVSQLVTDHYDHVHGIRWATNQATVYIDTTDPTLVAAYETALANWNSTGAFHFILVDSPDGADIVATDYSDSMSQAAGLAETQYNALTQQLTSVEVKLNTYYLLNPEFGYSFERIVHTAEHELGHAIGLEHNDDISVMQTAGSHYGIQDTDVQAVLALYAD